MNSISSSQPSYLPQDPQKENRGTLVRSGDFYIIRETATDLEIEIYDELEQRALQRQRKLQKQKEKQAKVQQAWNHVFRNRMFRHVYQNWDYAPKK